MENVKSIHIFLIHGTPVIEEADPSKIILAEILPSFVRVIVEKGEKKTFYAIPTQNISFLQAEAS